MAVRKTGLKSIALTAAVEEGPYYKEGSPERHNIAGPDTPGTKLFVEGRVLDIKGNPIAHAWLDFWSADGNGVYDNTGYNLRGHQFTDDEGRYRLETVRPHAYQMRSPHIHVKVRAAENSPVLTTQLFFPGEKSNGKDFLFEPKTLVNIEDMPGGQKASFDFVVEK